MTTERELYNAAMDLEEQERPVATTLTLLTENMFMEAEESPVGVFDRPESLAKLAKYGHDAFGFDSCEIFNIWSHTEYLGGKVNYAAEQPSVINHPYTLEDDFVMPDLDKYVDDPRTRISIDGCRILRQMAGDDTAVNCINSWGPLTTAGHLIGTEEVMMGLLMDPDNITRLLKFINEFNVKAYTLELNAGQADYIDTLSMAEPSATGDMIDTDTFRTFVLPYVSKEHKAMHDAGVKTMLHICGNTVANLPSMIECGSDAISVEQTVDPTTVCDIARGKVAMFGNVGPVDPLWQGTPETVKAAVNRSIDGGFRLIAPGCSFSPRTPDENLIAMAQAVKESKKSFAKNQ